MKTMVGTQGCRFDWNVDVVLHGMGCAGTHTLELANHINLEAVPIQTEPRLHEKSKDTRKINQQNIS